MSDTQLFAETHAFLERLCGFAASIPHPGYRSLALAEVAWAAVPLRRNRWTLEVARQAESSLPGPDHPDQAWGNQARARIGAVRARVEGWEAGRPYLEDALTWLKQQFPGGRRKQTQADVDARKAAVAWWKALAQASVLDAELIQGGRELLSTVPPNVQSQLALDAAAELNHLGLGDVAADLMREMLSPLGLAALPEVFVDYQHPVDAYRVTFWNAVEVLAEWGGRTGDAARVLECVHAEPQLIDELAPAGLAWALLHAPGDPTESGQSLQADLDARGHAFKAQLVRIAWLRCAAKGEGVHERAALLDLALQEAWAWTGSPLEPGHRLITRLLPLLPAFFPPEETLEILEDAHERCRGRATEEPYWACNIWFSVALCALTLAPSHEALDMQDRIVEAVEAACRPPPNGPWWLLCEVLDVCLGAAEVYGDPGLFVVDRVSRFVEGMADIEGARGAEAPYFFARTLLRCATVYHRHAREQARDARLKQVAVRARGLNDWDLKELVREVANEASAHRSISLAGMALDLAVGVDLSDWFGMELVTVLGRGVAAPIREVVDEE